MQNTYHELISPKMGKSKSFSPHIYVLQYITLTTNSLYIPFFLFCVTGDASQ